MNTLNFYPYYRSLLEDRTKTTTLRLPSKQRFQLGEKVMLTVGWPDEKHFEALHPAKIEMVYEKKLVELTEEDLAGESPDCLAVNAVPYVLGAIYRKILKSEDSVLVIKFKHSD
ncbi:MAG: hypothetical protein WBP65_12720 [Candidatus Sulfotelmatobacter sp.]|jgi:hypothetical protein